MPWYTALGLFCLFALLGAIPVGLIYLDPTDNFLTPLISNATLIVAQDKHLMFSAFFLFLPIAFCVMVAWLNPHQKLSKKKADQNWNNRRWALHKITVFTLLTCLYGIVIVAILGVFSQPAIMHARGYTHCWSVKIPSTFGAAKQAYAKRGTTCPAKPAVDKWGYWRE
jgi:heme/copper-type cytochrome/quinol oxidase subunit 2